MKNLTLLIIATLLMQITTISQTSCLPEGILFEYQYQIDNFQQNYPGCTEIEGDVVIKGYSNIANLYGLSVLTSIGGNLRIDDNYYALISLTGLENLISLGGYLAIADNLSLISLTGLENLISLGGYLAIADNLSLTSLAGLDNIDEGSISGLYIYSNYSLSKCHVQSVCDYLAAPNGNIDIGGNAPGCNSQQEVEDACETVSVNELFTSEYFTIYPNPLQSTATIKYNLSRETLVSVEIFSICGQKIHTLVNEVQSRGEQSVVFNTDRLKPGIYFCTLNTNEGMVTKKLIKLE